MDETVEPVRKRRRSSILNRQLPGEKPPPVNTEGSKDNKYVFKIPHLGSTSPEDEMMLKGYITDLETEKACWKTLLKERKALKESAKSSTIPQLSWQTAHTFLTEEDVAFLKNEPPFDKIAEDFDKLVRRVVISRVKYERVDHLATRIAGLAQLTLNNIKRNIAEYSDRTVDVPVAIS